MKREIKKHTSILVYIQKLIFHRNTSRYTAKHSDGMRTDVEVDETSSSRAFTYENDTPRVVLWSHFCHVRCQLPIARAGPWPGPPRWRSLFTPYPPTSPRTRIPLSTLSLSVFARVSPIPCAFHVLVFGVFFVLDGERVDSRRVLQPDNVCQSKVFIFSFDRRSHRYVRALDTHPPISTSRCRTTLRSTSARHPAGH